MAKKDEATPEVEGQPVATEAPVEAPEKDIDQTMLEAVDKSLNDLAPKAKDDEPEPPEETDESEAEPEAEPEEKEEPEAEPEKPEPEKPEPEKPDEAKKPSDEFGELPENTKPETAERFKTLKSKYDEQHTQLEAMQADFDAYVQRSEAFANEIKSTGTNAEQFGLMMNYIKKVNSGKKQDLEDAFAVLEQEYVTLARTLGKEGPNFDPLSDHADLKKRFEDGDLTREDALEIVQARSEKRLRDAADQASQQATTATTAKDLAYQQLTQMGAMIRKLDPHYKAKEQDLIKIAERVLKSERDPAKWADMISAEYAKLPNPQPATPRPKVVEPVRPGTVTTAGGKTAKMPGSAEEAVDMALAQIG